MNLRRAFFVWFLSCVGFATLAAAQQEPTDAREFLAQHAVFQNSSKTARAEEQATLRHARFYLHAGAEEELRHEVAKLTEGHPVALRYAMLADCWHPETYAKGLQRSREWLQTFPDRPAAEQQSVQSVQTFLQAKELNRELFLKRRRATTWLPLLSLLAVAVLIAGGVRWWP
jgi:hypothetical protein